MATFGFWVHLSSTPPLSRPFSGTQTLALRQQSDNNLVPALEDSSRPPKGKMPTYGSTAQSPPFGSPTKAAAQSSRADIEVEVEAQAEESVYELYEPLADGECDPMRL